MKTAEQAGTDRRTVLSLAEDLEGAVRDLRQAAETDLEQVRSSLFGAWRSDSADDFQHRLARVQEDLLAAAGSLSRAAEEIRSAAEDMRAAEQGT